MSWQQKTKGGDVHEKIAHCIPDVVPIQPFLRCFWPAELLSIWFVLLFINVLQKRHREASALISSVIIKGMKEASDASACLPPSPPPPLVLSPQSWMQDGVCVFCFFAGDHRKETSQMEL